VQGSEMTSTWGRGASTASWDWGHERENMCWGLRRRGKVLRQGGGCNRWDTAYQRAFVNTKQSCKEGIILRNTPNEKWWDLARKSQRPNERKIYTNRKEISPARKIKERIPREGWEIKSLERSRKQTKKIRLLGMRKNRHRCGKDFSNN